MHCKAFLKNYSPLVLASLQGKTDVFSTYHLFVAQNKATIRILSKRSGHVVGVQCQVEPVTATNT